jgi:5'-phosphate synthase pdxT subunit
MKTIAVLALQGGFAEHIKVLKSISVNAFEVRKEQDIKRPFDGLIIPGGESTVIFKLLEDFDLSYPIQDMVEDGLPVFGTCAGAILLANEVENREAYLKTMNISIKPNGYGSQLDSFTQKEKFNNISIEQIFVRAPIITKIGANVEILSKINGYVTAARQENQLVTTYHPELSTDEIHRYFISNFTKEN